MTVNLTDYPPVDLNPASPGRGTRRAERADTRPTYEAPRLIELTRASAIAICGEAGCPESPR